jgi:hypothetical protein
MSNKESSSSMVMSFSIVSSPDEYRSRMFDKISEISLFPETALRYGSVLRSSRSVTAAPSAAPSSETLKRVIFFSFTFNMKMICRLQMKSRRGLFLISLHSNCYTSKQLER